MSFVLARIIGIDLGVKDLGIRKWECSVCHTRHDCDYNVLVNIIFNCPI